MPECDHCGDNFGNEGAKKSHENACEMNPKNQGGSQQTAQQPQQPAQQARQAQPQGQPQQSQPPAQQPAQRQQQGQAPARQQDYDGGALQTGAQIGQTLASAGSGDPEAQAKATEEITQTLGAAIAQFGKQKAQQKLQGVQNARATDQEQIQRANEYPECPDCGTQLTNIPQSGEFRCPGCNAMLELTQGGGQ